MSIGKLWQKYDDELVERGSHPVEWPSRESPTRGGWSARCHLLWMLRQNLDGDKRHRWLGFIQGVLWILGDKTIHQLRDETWEALK